MTKPVLSIDVSKGFSVAATFLDSNKPLDKPFSFGNDFEGVQLVMDRLRNLEALTDKKPDVILEATGNYSKPLTSFFQESGYSVISLNPLQTHELKRKSIRKIKTDSIDTQRIADLYYQQEFSAMYRTDSLIADLKTLCRQYDGLMTLQTETQLKFQALLDLLFPTFPKVFSKLYHESALNVLKSFPTPESILVADKVAIIDCLSTCYQRKGWPDEIYVKLMAAAKACIPYKVAQESNVRVLREYVTLLSTQKRILTDLRAHITTTAKSINKFDLLTSIPGVGELTAAFILAEIEDITRFPTAKQLTAFAGLDPSVFESGKFKATKNRISKRGSSYLRKALFQAAAIGIRKRNGIPCNPTLYSYYSAKVGEGKPKMVALVATSNKLLRIIFGIWRSGQPFKA